VIEPINPARQHDITHDGATVYAVRLADGIGWVLPGGGITTDGGEAETVARYIARLSRPRQAAGNRLSLQALDAARAARCASAHQYGYGHGEWDATQARLIDTIAAYRKARGYDA